MLKIVVTYGMIAGVILGGMKLLGLGFQDQIGFPLMYFGVHSYRGTADGGRVTAANAAHSIVERVA